mgnify:CR=1 FL=1
MVTLPTLSPDVERDLNARMEAVEKFLSFTDRDPEESLGTILPDSRAATVWSIAVNGVCLTVVDHDDEEFSADVMGQISRDLRASIRYALDHREPALTHALQYARSRHQDSDFGRMRRQQQVVRAVINRLRRPEMLLKLPDIIGQVQSLIRTDLTPGQVFALAWTMKDGPPANIQTAVVDESYALGFMTPAGASVLRPQANRLKLAGL